MMPQPPKTPRWFAALCIVCLLPLVQMPWLLSRLPAGSDISPLLWIYPFYALADYKRPKPQSPRRAPA